MQNQIIKTDTFSYTQALTLKNETVWQELSEITISKAAEFFLSKLSLHTKKSYTGAFTIFFDQGFIDPFCTLQQFSLYNMESILDKMKELIKGTESTKQARCACFMSFTRYLARKTQGMIRQAVPCKEHGSITFRKIRNNATTNALNEKEMNSFLKYLMKYSFREYLIAKTILQGAKRINEVLSSKINQIDWEKNIIFFKQSKCNELEKFTYIHYPKFFMEELKTYIKDRPIDDFIFVTSQGKKIDWYHIYRTFLVVSERANISIRVTPHVLRASAITILSKKGYSIDQIMKVSGHTSSNSVAYYDKTPMEDNISKEVSLIGVG